MENSSSFDQLRRDLIQCLGAEQISSAPHDLETYGRDWMKDYPASPSLVCFPRSSEDVVQIIAKCRSFGAPIVPSGGRTGLAGGATAAYGEIVLSLERMRRILEISEGDRTATCEAGVVTEKLQRAVEEKGMFFPIDFSSRGSSQIGGNIATNAGGIRVIKYGNVRDWVLGLKVVTGTGQLLTLNGKLYKNNCGYDLRSLFVGSEGTLGIIVEATLKLTKTPVGLRRAWCGVPELSSVLELLKLVRRHTRELSAFEFMERNALEYVLSEGKRDPFRGQYPYYVLVEIEGNDASTEQEFTVLLEEAIEKGLVADAVMADSSQHNHELMQLRDSIGETLSKHHTLHKNDVSVPVSAVTDFVRLVHERLGASYPDFAIALFGHVGDGNLHLNILKPRGQTDAEFFSRCKAADEVVYSVVRSFGGSVAAEHGVGLLKRDFVSYTRSPEELVIMQGIKKLLDPDTILNRGKVLPEE